MCGGLGADLEEVEVSVPLGPPGCRVAGAGGGGLRGGAGVGRVRGEGEGAEDGGRGFQEPAAADHGPGGGGRGARRGDGPRPGR
ncbi:hypothetical protein GCM10020256_09790 [Streptomyces thermocoprophilus]